MQQILNYIYYYVLIFVGLSFKFLQAGSVWEDILCSATRGKPMLEQ